MTRVLPVPPMPAIYNVNWLEVGDKAWWVMILKARSCLLFSLNREHIGWIKSKVI